MSDQLRQSLSALMDNEADDLELRRILQQADDDPELMDTWRRYHLASAAMKQNLSGMAMTDLSQRIGQAIAEEPAPALQTASAEAATPPRFAATGVWSQLGKIAIAASVAAVVIWGAQITNLGGFEEAATPSVVATPADTAPVVTSTPVASEFVVTPPAPAPELQTVSQRTDDASAYPAPDPLKAQARLHAYLKQHAEHATASGGRSMIPLARAVSFSNDGNR